MGRCKRLLRFMGREVQGQKRLRMQSVKWVVVKLQGVKTASFCMAMSGREVTGRQISIPVFHGTFLDMNFWTPGPPRFLKKGFSQAFSEGVLKGLGFPRGA